MNVDLPYDVVLTDEDIISEVLEWAKNQSNFNTDFLESVLEWSRERDLTMGQRDAINNIIDGYHLNILNV